MAVTVTLKSVSADGRVVVNFSLDGKDQNLTGMPVKDKAQFVNALKAYYQNYKAGLDKAAAPTDVDPQITAAIGTPITVG